jgi:hypothetical protein
MVTVPERICQAIPASYILLGVKAKKPAKKPPARAAKKSPKTTDARVKLERDLHSAIQEIDDKGLLFLLRQAQVLIHNARMESLEERAGMEGQGAVAPRASSTRHSESVEIEDAHDGKTIFLTIGRTRKVLTPEEMKRLVRICYSTESKSEALRQLFTVLVKERKDILTDAMIGSPDSPLVTHLFNAVRAAYALEDR